MKSFNATWQASDWGEDEPDGVTVYRPGEESWDHLISHERQIEDAIPDAPDDLKSWVRVEVMANRELGENEWRTSDEIYEFRFLNGELSIRRMAPTAGHWYPADRFSRVTLEAALAYLDKHAPKLAENRRLDPSGVVWELRWNNGRMERRAPDSPNEVDRKWVEHRRIWESGYGIFYDGCEDWFRAHCPIDRFVTDEGEVLEFRMADSGEADAFMSGSLYCSTIGLRERFPEGELTRALYRFRDHERGKWTFEWRTDGDVINIYRDGVAKGTYGDAGENWSLANECPTWVRQKAKALYREKNPELDVRWYPNTSDGGAVDVFSGGNFCGRLTRHGFWPPLGDPNQPPHILTQARAKFRENYQLKRNEAWAMDQVITLKFENDEQGARVVVGPSYFWGKNSVRESVAVNKSWGYLITKNETERLELFDRACRLYFEELQLQRLTDDRLKREGEKVVFEGKWREIAPDNSRVTFEAYCGQLPAMPKGPLRVTIEPLGDG